MLEPLKRRDVLLAIMEFVLDLAWNCILDQFSKGSVIPADTVLIFGKLDKVVDYFPIMGKGDGGNCVFIIVLRGV